jgi:hypothetical protein
VTRLESLRAILVKLSGAFARAIRGRLSTEWSTSSGDRAPEVLLMSGPSSSQRSELGAKLCAGRFPLSAAIVLRNAKSALTVCLFPAAKASGQHPAAMALANANRAHGEIATRLTIPFQRCALAEPWPASLEPISGDGRDPACVT